MNHSATSEFWSYYHQLPREIQRIADKNYRLLAENPYHPSLHFKKIKTDLWSVRIGLGYRALGTEANGECIWFWIGSHADYNQLIK